MGMATAQIEVLNAEVRVLMVGSRQVTLSVYRQLDRVKHSECEPFGRVRDGQDKAYGEVFVVGRHVESGDLVRSSIGRPTSNYDLDEDELPLFFREWCSGLSIDWKWGHDPQRIPHSHGASLQLARDAESGCRVTAWVKEPTYHYGPDGEDRRWLPSDYEPSGLSQDEMQMAMTQEGKSHLAEVIAWQEPYNTWKDLPLIVLAGLR